MKNQQTVAYLASGLLAAAFALTSCSGGGSGTSGGVGANVAPNAASNGSRVTAQSLARDSEQSNAPDIAPFTFPLKVSPGAKTCLPKATGSVTLSSPNANEEMMHVVVSNLPKNIDFDVFLIQVPNAPFGLSWYQGDIQTNSTGAGSVNFLGRFSIETFIVAPGTAPAPVVFHNTFPDASSNPKTGPVHTYHVGIWFNDRTDAFRAGCPPTITPFNGVHSAGIQVLNTGGFPDLAGPLRSFNP